MMQLNITSKLKELSRSWVFWLLLITGIAIIIRSIPGWIHAAWGCDFGIYYQISNTVVESKEFFPPYHGWGGSYTEFPILYAVVAIAHWITGIDVIVIMTKLIPFIGALTVFIFYFIVKELTENKKIAILSALFLSVSAFHVYQLSHAAPLVMGHFFMMLSFYFYLKYRKNIWYIIPLIISTLFLIMSHHFTTYIYIISLISIVFFENLYAKEWTNSIKKDIIIILIASGLTFSYWTLVAKTVINSFMRKVFIIGDVRFHPLITIGIFYVLFFASFFVILQIRKMNIIKECKRPTVKSSLIKFSLAFVICFSIMLLFAIVDLPWTNFKFTPASIILSIPLLVMVSFVVAGFKYTRFIKNGLFIRGWLIGLVISFIFGLITSSTTILPERHIEYISYPVSIIAILGMGVIFSDPEFKGLISKIWIKKTIQINYFSKKIKIPHKHRLIFVILIAGIVITSAVGVYPSFRALGQSYEEITIEDINTIKWLAENINQNTSLIASDHKLERLAEAEGFNTTKDEIRDFWEAEEPSDFVEELYGIGRKYDRITHVVVDDIMKYDGVHMGHKIPIFHMINETWTGGYDKFSNEQIFTLIYRNESMEMNLEKNEAVRWAEVYEINWTYLEKEYPIS